MTIAFIAQAENSSTSNITPISTSTTLTLLAGDLVEVVMMGSTTATIAVTDGTNTYTQQGGTLASSSPEQMYVFVAQNCAAGTVTVTATSTVGGVYGLYARQIRGAAISGAVLGVASLFQNSPAATANSIMSGNITLGSTANILLTGFCANPQATTPIPTAGTSPIAFTGNTNVWTTFGGGTGLSEPEYLRIAGASGTVQATFGCGGGGLQYSNILTVAVAYAELVASNSAAIAWVT